MSTEERNAAIAESLGLPQDASYDEILAASQERNAAIAEST